MFPPTHRHQIHFPQAQGWIHLLYSNFFPCQKQYPPKSISQHHLDKCFLRNETPRSNKFRKWWVKKNFLLQNFKKLIWSMTSKLWGHFWNLLHRDIPLSFFSPPQPRSITFRGIRILWNIVLETLTYPLRAWMLEIRFEFKFLP